MQETLIRAWKSAEHLPGALVGAHLALPHRHQRLPDQPRGPAAAARSRRGSAPRTRSPATRSRPTTRSRGSSPCPDAAVVVAEKDTIRLAFVAALQHLPTRQRAVLILRDVLRWSAAETAEALDTTTAAVNSALQRAHAVMADKHPDPDTVTDELSPAQRMLLDQYVEAFWRKDIDAIVSMLRHEAIWEMPPFLNWYVGAENIGKLISIQCPGGVHDMVMLPTTANGQPTFALYMRETAGDPDSDVHAVPPAGARPRRRPRPARGGVLREGSVREVRAARPAPRRLGARRRRDAVTRTRRPDPPPRAGAARAGPGLHPGRPGHGRTGPLGPDALRGMEPRRPARPHGRRPRRVPRGRRGRRTRARGACAPGPGADLDVLQTQGLPPAGRVERADARRWSLVGDRLGAVRAAGLGGGAGDHRARLGRRPGDRRRRTSCPTTWPGR